MDRGAWQAIESQRVGHNWSDLAHKIPLPGGGAPSSRSSSSQAGSLPLQPPSPPSCSLDSIPDPVLPPGPWGTRTVHLGRGSILLALRPQLLLAGPPTLRVPHPVPLFPSNCQPAPPRPHPGRSRSAKTLGLHFPEAEVFIPCAANRIRKAHASAPTLSSWWSITTESPHPFGKKASRFPLCRVLTPSQALLPSTPTLSLHEPGCCT